MDGKLFEISILFYKSSMFRQDIKDCLKIYIVIPVICNDSVRYYYSKMQTSRIEEEIKRYLVIKPYLRKYQYRVDIVEKDIQDLKYEKYITKAEKDIHNCNYLKSIDQIKEQELVNVQVTISPEDEELYEKVVSDNNIFKEDIDSYLVSRKAMREEKESDFGLKTELW